VDIDPRVGGGFTIIEARDGKPAEHYGVYREIARPRGLEFDVRRKHRFVPVSRRRSETLHQGTIASRFA
jgi:ribosomal protein L13E